MPPPGRHLDQFEPRLTLDVDGSVQHALLLVAMTAGARSGRCGVAGRVPLEIERDRGRVAVRATERLIGVVDGRGIGLVADRPLMHLGVAVMFGPQRLSLHDERIGANAHVEVGDVQERSAAACERRPVPRSPPDDPMARDQAELRVGRPGGEHPFLDVGSEVAAVVVFVGEHDQADYEP